MAVKGNTSGLDFMQLLRQEFINIASGKAEKQENASESLKRR